MPSENPLCIDLDGTLIKSDLLLESVIRLIKQNFLWVFFLPFWLLRGRAWLKQEIAKRVVIDYSSLPYNQNVVEHIRAEKSSGRKLVLVTASNKLHAENISGHLDLFDAVYASDGTINLKGEAKAEKLVQEFGERGFDYMANEEVDLHIWKCANTAILVNANSSLVEKVRRYTPVEIIQSTKSKSKFRFFIKAIRPYQWVKNILIFIPLLLAHEYTDQLKIMAVLQAFVSFCFCASAVYLFNDLMDLEADRLHPVKSQRPFASGDLSLLSGLIGAPLLLLLSVGLALNISIEYFLVFSIYFLLTTAYSLGLKTIALLDVFILAGLYTIRVLAGTVAANVDMSFWLLVFSLFMFFSLAMVKRFSELLNLTRRYKKETAGRGYMTEDITILALLGVSSGYIAVLVMALYLQTPEHVERYQNPELLWMVFPALLYWVSRVWLLAYRGEIDEDPVLFAVKDMQSYIIVLITVAGIALAL